MKPLHLALALLITVLWGFNFVAAKDRARSFPDVRNAAAALRLTGHILFPFLRVPRDKLRPVMAVGFHGRCPSLFAELLRAWHVGRCVVGGDRHPAFHSVRRNPRRHLSRRTHGSCGGQRPSRWRSPAPWSFRSIPWWSIISTPSWSSSISAVPMASHDDHVAPADRRGPDASSSVDRGGRHPVPTSYSRSFSKAARSKRFAPPRSRPSRALCTPPSRARLSAMAVFTSCSSATRDVGQSAVLLAPVFAIFFGVTVYGDQPTLQILVGGFMTIAGVAIIAIRSAAKGCRCRRKPRRESGIARPSPNHDARARRRRYDRFALHRAWKIVESALTGCAIPTRKSARII